MTRKVAFIVLDGLRYDAARLCLGYMEALVSAGEAQVHRLACELPSLSRPLYATLMTGLAPVRHGIVGNADARTLDVPNVFSLARAAGLTTAAAAYHWVSELFNEAPFDPAHRLTEWADGHIQHGVFYWSDAYPGDHTFADAHGLILRADPDFVLVHPMNIDDAGHKAGGESTIYRQAVRAASASLAHYVPLWRERGYTIIVTSDHGMGADGSHGGPEEGETQVPFYTVDPKVFVFDRELSIAQTEIAGTLCALLGLEDHDLPVAQGLIRGEADDD